MTTSNATRFLAASGDDTALALEMFLGVVQENFYANTLLWNAASGDYGIDTDNADNMPPQVVRGKTISSGKSWQFVQIADSIDPEYHTPGVELLGQNYAFDEGNITIDGILVSHRDIPIDQIQQAHWEVVEPIARGMGRSLARDFDRKLFVIGCKAALEAAKTKVVGSDTFTLHNGGNVVERVGADQTGAYPVSQTGARNFRDDLEHLAQLLDDDNVPEMGRYLVYTNYIHRVLQQDTTIFDEQFTRGNSNSLNNRVIGKIAGFNLLGRTNNLPSTNITASTWGGGVPSKYQGDFRYNGTLTRPVALALCGAEEGQAGIGFVAASNDKLGPIYAVREHDTRRNTEFLKAQMMVGADKLFPPCAGAITVDDA